MSHVKLYSSVNQNIPNIGNAVKELSWMLQCYPGIDEAAFDASNIETQTMAFRNKKLSTTLLVAGLIIVVLAVSLWDVRQSLYIEKQDEK